MECSELINELISDLEAITLPYPKEKIDALDRRSKMIVTRLFSAQSTYVTDLDEAFHPRAGVIYMGKSNAEIERRRQVKWENARIKIKNIFNTILEDCQLTDALESSKEAVGQTIQYSNKVFIVHGQDEAIKQAVARVIEKLHFEAIILHEQPNAGKTIIEKFLDYSDVGFAIVLLSPDDKAYPKSLTPKMAKSRARQNVIFELGYFLGRLGRERVLALYQEENRFELPSDYAGVVYVKYDDSGHWKFEIVRGRLNILKCPVK